MNNQQGPFNSPFFPKMGERETEPSDNTKSTNPNGRLGHKTSLRGLRQHRGPVPASFPVDNAGNNGAQPFAPSQQSWGANGPQSFMPPQQSWNNTGSSAASPQQPSWNEMATQAFQDAQHAQQPWNGLGAQGSPSSPAQPTQRTPSGQLGHGSSLFNNPMFPGRNSQQLSNEGAPANNIQTGPYKPVNGSPSGMYPNATRNLGNSGAYPHPTGNLGSSGTFNSPTGALGNSGMHSDATQNLGLVPSPTGTLGNTGTLMHPAGEYSGDTGMLKLNQAVKVVRIPIPGKPGEYKTGILPVLSQGNTGALPPPTPNPTFQDKVKKNGKILVLATLIVLVLIGTGIYQFTRSGGNMAANQTSTDNGNNAKNLNATATANVQATATFENSVLISDPLSSNTRGWLTTENRPDLVKKGISMYFKNSAYHISSARVGDIAYFASSVLRNENLSTKYTYSVDMQQVKGQDDNDFNFFGLLFSYTEIGGQPISYAFRIIDNKSNLRYEFCTLDGRKDPVWSDPIWKQNAGKEFHGGKAKNNLQVHVDGHNFTFWVNGKQVGKAHDTSFGTGAIGLGVNGQGGGSEVAFTNFLLTSD